MDIPPRQTPLEPILISKEECFPVSRIKSRIPKPSALSLIQVNPTKVPRVLLFSGYLRRSEDELVQMEFNVTTLDWNTQTDPHFVGTYFFGSIGMIFLKVTLT